MKIEPSGCEKSGKVENPYIKRFYDSLNIGKQGGDKSHGSFLAVNNIGNFLNGSQNVT